MLASNLRLSPFRVALLATLAAAIVYLPASQLGIVQQLEGELLDLRFQARPPQPTSGEIVLVLIDDASLAEVGRWPWSRSLMADLVARLEAAGAGTVALDLLLAEPESSGVPTAALAPLLQGDDALARLPELIEQAEGDPRLAAEAARAGNVVLPILFEPAQDEGRPRTRDRRRSLPMRHFASCSSPRRCPISPSRRQAGACWHRSPSSAAPQQGSATSTRRSIAAVRSGSNIP